MIRLLRGALALSCCALLAMPAFAVTFATYIFDFHGRGITSTYTPFQPSNYTYSYFEDARVIFTVPDVTDQSHFEKLQFPNIGVINSNLDGLQLNFPNGNASSGSITGFGKACFSNPGGLFPTTQVTLIDSPDCGSITYQENYGYDNDQFTGKLTALTVISGETSGINGSFTIIKNAVPEPATWALMVLGFGAAGLSIRARKQMSAVCSRS